MSSNKAKFWKNDFYSGALELLGTFGSLFFGLVLYQHLEPIITTYSTPEGWSKVLLAIGWASSYITFFMIFFAFRYWAADGIFGTFNPFISYIFYYLNAFTRARLFILWAAQCLGASGAWVMARRIYGESLVFPTMRIADDEPALMLPQTVFSIFLAIIITFGSMDILIELAPNSRHRILVTTLEMGRTIFPCLIISTWMNMPHEPFEAIAHMYLIREIRPRDTPRYGEAFFWLTSTFTGATLAQRVMQYRVVKEKDLGPFWIHVRESRYISLLRGFSGEYYRGIKNDGNRNIYALDP